MSKQDLITAPTESRFQVDVEKNWVESSKVNILLRELESLRLSGSKSIVFSSLFLGKNCQIFNFFEKSTLVV